MCSIKAQNLGVDLFGGLCILFWDKVPFSFLAIVPTPEEIMVSPDVSHSNKSTPESSDEWYHGDAIAVARELICIAYTIRSSLLVGR
jgi:hypothetical protein